MNDDKNKENDPIYNGGLNMVCKNSVNFWENEIFPTKWLRPDVGYIPSDTLLGPNNIHYCPTYCGIDNKLKKNMK
jgi:hypothetical protein